MSASVAIILARGESRRMGRPKGLVRGRDNVPFVRTIAGLYRGLAKVLVVARQEEEEAYRRALAGLDRWRVVGRGPGGETARTLLIARRAAPGAVRYWAHPVDLPLVGRGTLEALADTADRNPQAVIRPFHAGRPGHPVVIPAGVLDMLAVDPQWAERPFRDFLTAGRRQGAPEVLAMPVDDEGTVKDFDAPGDLPRDGGNRE